MKVSTVCIYKEDRFSHKHYVFLSASPFWGQPPQLLGVMKCRKKTPGFNNLAGCVFVW